MFGTVKLSDLLSVLVEDMCRRYPNAIAVNIYGTPAIQPLVMIAIASLRYIISDLVGYACFSEMVDHL